jgi:flagella basal body P-ring formation protein FlgA
MIFKAGKAVKNEWVLPCAVFALVALLHSRSAVSASAPEAESEQDDAPVAAAVEPAQSAQDRLVEKLSQGIAKQYPGAKISVNPTVHWTHGALSESFQNVSLLGETSRGEIMFSVTNSDGARGGEGWASFSAWVPARVASKRVHPGDRLTADMFAIQNVNVALGQAHELRGVILEPETEIGNLEARQSVLEGQMLLSTSVQRVPDVRRGDAVVVMLVSNGLSLQTQGVAEEPAYAGGQIRVTASKTKRELVGRLSAGGVVEVKL